MDKAAKVEIKTQPEVTAEERPLKDETIVNMQDMTILEKLKCVKSNITVEPVLALFVMPSMLALMATQNLNLEKACKVNLKFDDIVCHNLKIRKRENLTFEEDEVQKLIASVYAWKSVIQTIVPTILMMFIGAWSDKTGRRKICMLMPIFSEMVTCILNMINTYFFTEVPVEWTVLMEVFFPALSGGWNTIFLGTFSYLGDITSRETRTYRMGMLNLCMTLGFPIAMGLSGVLLRSIGYYGVFGISASLQFVNFMYVLLVIDDHKWLQDKENVTPKKGCAGFFLDFFDIHSLKKTMEITFKKGHRNRRLRICMILTVVCLTFGPLWGELSVKYIFTRYRFNWDEMKYSIFATYSLITHSAGTLFSLTVFSKKLKVDDAVLGIISTLSKISGSLVFAFARTDAEVYLAPIAEILDGTSIIALRSIVSKLVTYKELGKVFSLFAVAETMMPLVASPIYSKVYVLTLHVLPGAFFLISVLLTIPACGILVWFYRQQKQDRKDQRLEIPSTPPVPDENATITDKPCLFPHCDPLHSSIDRLRNSLECLRRPRHTPAVAEESEEIRDHRTMNALAGGAAARGDPLLCDSCQILVPQSEQLW